MYNLLKLLALFLLLLVLFVGLTVHVVAGRDAGPYSWQSVRSISPATHQGLIGARPYRKTLANKW